MTTQTLAFQAEMTQMMDIIIHSLYSKREIFLRELISNASDAIDKLRFESVTQPELLEGVGDFKIRLIADPNFHTLTIRDNGIGLSLDDAVANLGTLAKSGTKDFLARLQAAEAKDRPELIGQFGLGFYSAFMVADKITVLSRPAGPAKTGVRWESDGKGQFVVEAIEKDTPGTDIILSLREDAHEFEDEYQLRHLVRTYSDFIGHPIVMEVEHEHEGQKERHDEQLNSGKAIWQRAKNELSENDYNEFYKHLTHDFEPPARSIHYSAEGTVEFKALVYIPAKRPFDFLWPDRKHGLSLYIKRVFISDEVKDLLPPYLRFVRGVVDAADLPLNVSREMLQKNPVLDNIRTNITSKILSSLAEMKETNFSAYQEFFKAFGIALKEGVYSDFANKAKLADLLLFEAVGKPAGQVTTLKDYRAAMPEGQNEIYYLLGENRSTLERSPYIEKLRQQGYDVLLLTEPIDEWMMGALDEYDGKKLKAADKTEHSQEPPEAKEYSDFLAYLGGLLSEVKDVRLSSRLVDSAACLVSEEGQMGAYLENVMKKIGADGDFPKNSRHLELNPEHPVVKGLKTLFDSNKDDPRLTDYTHLLYDQALIAEGSKLPDPKSLATRLNLLIQKDLSR